MQAHQHLRHWSVSPQLEGDYTQEHVYQAIAQKWLSVYPPIA
jgi:hypothetical protein